MKTIHALKIWATRRPWQFCGFMAAFMILSTIIDYLPLDPVTSLVTVLSLLGALIGLILIISFQHRVPVIIVLSIALVSEGMAHKKQEADAAGVGVAIVVVCVGGYCVYKIVRFCQKNLPKDKPANTNELYSVSGGVGDEYGAAWNHGSLGSCLDPDATGKSALLSGTANPATLFTLNVFVASPTELRRTMTADTRPEAFQSWVQFQSEVASHGLHVSGQNDGTQYFSRNGSPVPAGEVPLRFDTATGQVVHDRGGQLVQIVIEASADLEHWQRLASVVHGVGEGFQIADVSEQGFQFYRTRIEP